MKDNNDIIKLTGEFTHLTWDERRKIALSVCVDVLQDKFDPDKFADGIASESIGDEHYEISGQYTKDGNPVVIDFE